jgi:hypothetical protein
MLFAALASGLWIINSIYSIGYMRGNKEQNQTRFYVMFAVSLAATMGVAFAGNLITLFLFYEMLTLSTYPLVAHKGDENTVRSARIYLGILLTTSIGLFLPAIIWTYSVAGGGDFVPGGSRGRPVARTVRIWHRQGRRHARASLAAGRHGCAHACECVAARRGRCQGGCVYHHQGHRVCIWRRLPVCAAE